MDQSNPKFTRGEKCIFSHLVLVFVSTLILVIIFIIHLYVVQHTEKTTIKTRRTGTDLTKRDYSYVGEVYLNITPRVTICNSLLLGPKWSLSPANCVVIRTNPDIAFALYSWTINYSNQYSVKIKKSIPHPLFDKDTFSNNVGLFKHANPISLQPHFPASKLPNVALKTKDSKLAIVTKKNRGNVHAHRASFLNIEKCIQDISFIVDLRSYEFCIAPVDRNTSLEYGSLVLLDEDVIGIYSWGERRMYNIPFVVLNISHFYNWFNGIVLKR